MSDSLGGEYILHGRESFLSKLQKKKEAEEASTPAHRYSTRESRGALSPTTPPSSGGSLWVEQEASEAPIPLKGYYAVVRWEHLPEVCRVGHDMNAGADPYALMLGTQEGYEVLMKRQMMQDDIGSVATSQALPGPWTYETPPSLLAMLPVHTRPVASIPSLFHRILCLLQFATLVAEGRDIVPTVDKRILKSTQRKLPANIEPIPGLALAYKACHPGPGTAVSTAGLSRPLFDVNGDFCRFDHPVSSDKRQVLVDAQGHEYVVVACRREHVQLLYSAGAPVTAPQRAQRGRGPSRGRGRRGNRVKTTVTTEDYIGEGGSTLDGVLTKAAVCPHAVSVYYYTTNGVVCVGGREVLDMPCTCGFEAQAAALDKDIELSKEKEKKGQVEGVVGVEEELIKDHERLLKEKKIKETKAWEATAKGGSLALSAFIGDMVDEDISDRRERAGEEERSKDAEADEEDQEEDEAEEEERKHFHECPAIASRMVRGVYIHPYVRDIVNVENVSTHGSLAVNGGIGGHYHVSTPRSSSSTPSAGSERGKEEIEAPRTPRAGVAMRQAVTASGGVGAAVGAPGLGLGAGAGLAGTPQAKRGGWPGAAAAAAAMHALPSGTPGYGGPQGVGAMGWPRGTAIGAVSAGGLRMGLGYPMEEAEEALWEDVGEVDEATKALLEETIPRARKGREGGAVELLSSMGIVTKDEERLESTGAAAGIMTNLVRGSPMVQALLRHIVSVIDAYSRVHRDRAAIARIARERAEAETQVLRKTLAEVKERAELAEKERSVLRERVEGLERRLSEYAAERGVPELPMAVAAPGRMSDAVLASPTVSGGHVVTITSNAGVTRGVQQGWDAETLLKNHMGFPAVSTSSADTQISDENLPANVVTAPGLPVSAQPATEQKLTFAPQDVIGAGPVHEMLISRMGRVRAREEEDVEQDKDKAAGKKLKVTTSSTSKSARIKAKGKLAEATALLSPQMLGEPQKPFLTSANPPPPLPTLPHLDASQTVGPWRQALPPPTITPMPPSAVSALPMRNRASAMINSPVSRAMVRVAEAEREAAQQRAFAQLTAGMDRTTLPGPAVSTAVTGLDIMREGRMAPAQPTAWPTPIPVLAEPLANLLSAQTLQVPRPPTTALHALLAPPLGAPITETSTEGYSAGYAPAYAPQHEDRSVSGQSDAAIAMQQVAYRTSLDMSMLGYGSQDARVSTPVNVAEQQYGEAGVTSMTGITPVVSSVHTTPGTVGRRELDSDAEAHAQALAVMDDREVRRKPKIDEGPSFGVGTGREYMGMNVDGRGRSAQ